MNKSLYSCLSTRNNNLDLMRFVAALAVIYSHSFDLTYNTNSEPLYKATHQLLSIGHFSVAIFFIISGFLITQSYDRSKSLYDYFSARILRIYPGLIFVICCTVFLIGPFWTSYEITKYFSDINTIKYLINVSALKIYFPLGGVLQSEPYPNYAVNGSLWTLPYEMVCYLLVPAIGLLFKRQYAMVLILSFLSAIFIFFQQIEPFFVNIFCFLCGATLYLFRSKISLNPVFFLICTSALLVNFLYNSEFISFNVIMGICLSYITIFIAFYKVGITKDFSKKGDYSYGLYIWAFPVQQIVFYNWRPMSPLMNFIISAPITLMLAYISWNLIEKNALKLKKYRLLSLRFNRLSFLNKS